MNKEATPAVVRKRSLNRQPLLWASLAYAAGVYVGREVWRPASWWTAAALFFAIVSLYFIRRRTKPARLFALAAIGLAGVLIMQVRSPHTADSGTADSGILQFADGREIVVTAHVTHEGDWSEHGPHEFRLLLDLETEQIQTEEVTRDIQSVIRIGIYRKAEGAAISSPLAYGQRLCFPAKLLPPHNFRNPGAFDYQTYLAEGGIEALGSTKYEQIETLPGFAGNNLERWRTRIHRSIIEQVHQLWPASQAALVDAMVIGEDEFLGRDIRTEFQRTGTYHVLVVSGMNVGILAFVVFWALRRLRISDIAATLLTVMLCVVYAFLTDVGAPVWRATLMLLLYLGVRLLYRDRSMLNAIGAAILGLLIVDPNALFGASFQLTFLCVLLIAAVGSPILERTSEPYLSGVRSLASTTYDCVLPPHVAQFRLDLRMIAKRLQRLLGKTIPLKIIGSCVRATLSLGELFWISAVMQIGLALPMAYYFHRATFVGLPANILVVPLTEIMMPTAIVAVTLGYFSLVLAKLPALVTALTLQIITGGLSWFGTLRLADARVATPSEFAILACVLALAAAMLLARRKALFAAAGLIVLFVTTAWICLVPPTPQIRSGMLELTAIDVGQGDSLLLVFPDGGTMLVDSGGMPHWMHSEFDMGEQVVSPYLWSRGISHLDTVVVTHPHGDHMGGMAAIPANFHPRELWIGAGTASAELDGLLKVAKQLGVKVVTHEAGNNELFGGAQIRVLAPQTETPTNPRRQNDDTLAMKVSFRGSSMLLLGDAERPTERLIALEHPEADLLKVAHHRSATSTSAELLDAGASPGRGDFRGIA